METNSAVITLNPVEYTEKMRRVLENFTRLSREATTVQEEPAVYNSDINNLALQIYSPLGDKKAAERMGSLVTTQYSINHLGNITTVTALLLSSIEHYTQQIVFEINNETGEIIRKDIEFEERTGENGVTDRSIRTIQKPVRNPLDVISHMNVDMYLMMQNHTAYALGKIAS